ncbi:MAG: hypothetical protein E7129_06280 [Rikenellaceae bacterium]|nr:hypothetical protein [Rikenellaceae bacterium]
MVACFDAKREEDGGDDTFIEKEATTITFTEAEVYYNGDDIGEATSDGWLVKFYTDMEMDQMGNFVGPGEVMQLLLSAPFNSAQKPDLSKLVGEYRAQSNSGDFSPNTFAYGYMDYIDLPDGRHERPEGTFYASIPDGSTEMNIDLLDDGSLEIISNGDGTYTIDGVLVGKQCRKRNFSWRGVIEPKSQVVEQVPNSLLTSDLRLTNLTKAHLQDRGDSFYLGDNSYRNILVFLAEESISFEWGNPKGSGNILRLELLVPWETDIAQDGIPVGEYPMLTRNADTSFDKESIAPFHSISGLPDSFTVPYWSGAWYVKYADGKWGDSYARIDGGTITVERGADGSHRFICNLQDCSSPSFAVEADVTISNENLIR